MAIDTEAKRRSAANTLTPLVGIIPSDGMIGVFDRRHIAGYYAFDGAITPDPSEYFTGFTRLEVGPYYDMKQTDTDPWAEGA